ncbi:hypothetical protein QTP70_034192, partial [Hemibagrus guttatus]
MSAGKMGKRKDLSEFDKDQIVMARRLDQSISKTAALVGCSWSAVVSIYQKWCRSGSSGKPWTRTTYLSIGADHLHPFMETVFPDGCGLFQQDNVLCHKGKMVQEWFDEHNNEFVVLTWPPDFSRSQFNRVSVGSAGHTSLIHGGPTWLLKESPANILESMPLR